MNKVKTNPRKAVMVGCGFVGSASVFALMQSGLFSEIVLIDADKDKAEGEDIIKGVNRAQQLIQIVNDELVNILAKNEAPLNLEHKPTLIMMLGLQGSGKTTSSAKLAVKLKKEGKNPLLVACDVYRPAAINQLKTLAQQIEIECFSIDGSKYSTVHLCLSFKTLSLYSD